MTAQQATRAFPESTYTNRTMAALARTIPGTDRRHSQLVGRHGAALMLALAAHHDLDRRQHTAPIGYTPTELAPFVGMTTSSAAATLLELNRTGWCERYTTARRGHRYLLAPSLFGPVK
jgi:DNA-binding MarR family transcriptional regulator